MLVSPGYHKIDHYLYTHKPCKRYASERADLYHVARVSRLYGQLRQQLPPKLVRIVQTRAVARPFNAPRFTTE